MNKLSFRVRRLLLRSAFDPVLQQVLTASPEAVAQDAELSPAETQQLIDTIAEGHRRLRDSQQFQDLIVRAHTPGAFADLTDDELYQAAELVAAEAAHVADPGVPGLLKRVSSVLPWVSSTRVGLYAEEVRHVAEVVRDEAATRSARPGEGALDMTLAASRCDAALADWRRRAHKQEEE